MNRFSRLALVLTLFFLASLPATAQVSARDQEKLIRDTYRKLESYNAAAQIFQLEQSNRPRREAGLSFALGDFRSGDVKEIAIDGAMTGVLSGKRWTGTLRLEPLGVDLLEK